MKKLLICGRGPSVQYAPLADTSWECWGFVRYHNRHFDRLYECHGGEVWARLPDMVARMHDAGDRLWMRLQTPQFPKANIFPMHDLIKLAHGYLTNSVAIMIAHALYEDRWDVIGVYGADFTTVAEERTRQRNSVEFMCGIAIGRGVKVVTPMQSPLLTSPVYGTPTKWVKATEKVLEELRD